MSDIFFTRNMATVYAANVTEAQRIQAITLQTYAGQSDLASFRIGSDETGFSSLVYTSDPNITMSYNDARGFAPALDYSIDAGEVGSTIYVKLTAPLDPTEGDRNSQIIAGNNILLLNYFLASTHEGDTDTPAIERFLGQETINLIEQFENEGESVVLYRYDPLPKPTEQPATTMTNDQFTTWSDPAEWCNPNNSITGYKLKQEYPVKVFIGNQNLTVDSMVDHITDDLSFEDESRILLPPDFDGFNPQPVHKAVAFGDGITNQTKAYQRTQWTVKRNNAEYALLNIRKQSYYRGQFIFWIADLARIHYPGADSSDGFLPWNQLYNESGKIVQYVKSWSIAEHDPYDPYLMEGS